MIRKAQPQLPDTLDCKATILSTGDPEQGILECIVSTFGVRDYGNDVMQLGCFTKSLKQRKPVGLWMHKLDQVVAKTLEAKELKPNDPMLPDALKAYGGLYIKAQFNLETPEGRSAWSNVKGGYIEEFSIGFKSMVDTVKDGMRFIKEAFLVEWSLVIMGMNPLTTVLSTKDAAPMKKNYLEQKAEYLGEYVEVRATATACETVINALYYRLYECFYNSQMTVEEKVTFIDQCCEEASALIVQIAQLMLSTLTEAEQKMIASDFEQLSIDPAEVKSVSPRTGFTLKQQIDFALTANQSLLTRMQSVASWKAAERAGNKDLVLSEQNRKSISEQVGSLKIVLADAEALLEKTTPVDDVNKAAALQVYIKRVAATASKYKE